MKSDLIYHAETPPNAETPLALLDTFITPTERFFVRCHSVPPVVDAAAYRLTIDGLVGRPLTFTLAELRRLPAHSAAVTLQCAGNHRAPLMQVAPIHGEVPWGDGAVGTAVWTGVRLRDLLDAADVRDAARYVHFVGLDADAHAPEGFGGSIALASADTALIAYAMNDAPLTPEHGSPVRAVVPATIGARSVKWLRRITVSDVPSDNYYQRDAYRLLPADGSERGAFALDRNALTSFITSPADGAVVAAGAIPVSGAALGALAIARVELSTDGGTTWSATDLDAGGGDGTSAWRRWSAEVQLAPGTHTLVCRAFDTAANTQPEHAAAVWNPKGYVNNSWHRVPITVR